MYNLDCPKPREQLFALIVPQAASYCPARCFCKHPTGPLATLNADLTADARPGAVAPGRCTKRIPYPLTILWRVIVATQATSSQSTSPATATDDAGMP